jgi:hypothetical protein
VAAEKKPAKKSPAEAEKGSLKVNANTLSLVQRVAAMRGLTVAQLFDSRDVEDFFTHLLLEELRLATAQLEGRSKR